jgi:hypothetical protein
MVLISDIVEYIVVIVEFIVLAFIGNSRVFMGGNAMICCVVVHFIRNIIIVGGSTSQTVIFHSPTASLPFFGKSFKSNMFYGNPVCLEEAEVICFLF